MGVRPPALRGDPRLGSDAYRRFLPSRFNPHGDALDAADTPCTQLACPRCRLAVFRVCLEAQPWFVSLFGAPASGKSYLLAAMMRSLRQQLPGNAPGHFQVSFTDSDAAANEILAGWEEKLFCNPAPDDEQILTGVIQKTKEQGDSYNATTFGAETVLYSKPFMFTLRLEDGHPAAADAARVLCFYDNVGESFRAGDDRATSPVTRHLAESALLLFLYDPIQHQPFRRRLEERGIPVASGLPERTAAAAAAGTAAGRHAGRRRSAGCGRAAGSAPAAELAASGPAAAGGRFRHVRRRPPAVPHARPVQPTRPARGVPWAWIALGFVFFVVSGFVLALILYRMIDA